MIMRWVLTAALVISTVQLIITNRTFVVGFLAGVVLCLTMLEVVQWWSAKSYRKTHPVEAPEVSTEKRSKPSPSDPDFDEE
jgi:hypothetical protein